MTKTDSCDKAAKHSSGASVSESGPAPCDRGRLLIVDDEAAILSLFRLIISAELPELRIDLAANGKQAVQEFTQGRHCVLLMDLHMPVMDGQLAFSRIRHVCSSRNWEMPSVVFCTGYAPPRSLVETLRDDDAHCLLSKPVSADTLVQTVRDKL